MNEEIGKFSLYNYGSILAIKTSNTILFKKKVMLENIYRKYGRCINC